MTILKISAAVLDRLHYDVKLAKVVMIMIVSCSQVRGKSDCISLLAIGQVRRAYASGA